MTYWVVDSLKGNKSPERLPLNARLLISDKSKIRELRIRCIVHFDAITYSQHYYEKYLPSFIGTWLFLSHLIYLTENLIDK